MASAIQSLSPCPCEAHSDQGFKLMDDGTARCFSAKCPSRRGGDQCAYFSPEKTEALMSGKPIVRKAVHEPQQFVTGRAVELQSRGITKETCEKFEYEVGKNRFGEYVQVANYYDFNGTLTGQKLRDAEKNFTVVGQVNSLFGLNALPHYSSKDYCVITTGELDALAYAQATNFRYPVLSIPHGDTSAKKHLQQNLRWLEKEFKKIVLAFDQDESGQNAVKEVSSLFSPRKCYIAEFSEKDINALLLEDKTDEITNLTRTAKVYKPDRIVYIDDLRPLIHEVPAPGIDTPWPSLTKMTDGVRLHEVWVLGAGSGSGKTEIFKEFILGFREQQKKTGVIFLEEIPDHTTRCLVGKHQKAPFHLEYDCLPKEKVNASLDFLRGVDGNSVSFYDNFGCNSVEEVKQQMYWMINADGCEYLFLDHITALTYSDPKKSANDNINIIMQELATITREKPVTLFMISHLRKKQAGKSHEEGGAVILDDFYGAAGIKQWASFCIGLERNRFDPETKDLPKLVGLKDRRRGKFDGEYIQMKYDRNTCRIIEDSGYPFEQIVEGF